MINKISQFSYFSVRTTTVLLAIILWLPLSANAQQWAFEPILSVDVNYDDNLRLATDDQIKRDDIAALADINARFVRRGQTSDFRFAPRLRTRQFSKLSQDDYEEYFLDLFGERRLQRGRYGVQIRASQRDTLRSEIDDPDFDDPDVIDPVNDDTGFVQIENSKDRFIVSPYVEFELTERLQLGIESSYVDVDYERNLNGLFDYDSLRLATTLAVDLSERITLEIEAFGQDYEALGTIESNQTDSIGGVVLLDNQFTETLSGRIGVGYESIESDIFDGTSTQSESTDAPLYFAGLTKRADLSRLVIDLRQTIDPSGTGFLQKRSQARLRYLRDLNARWKLNIEARYQTVDNVTELPDQFDREFQRYKAGLQWFVSPNLSIRAAYTFTTQDFDQQDAKANSNAFTIGFLYDRQRGK